MNTYILTFDTECLYLISHMHSVSPRHDTDLRMWCLCVYFIALTSACSLSSESSRRHPCVCSPLRAFIPTVNWFHMYSVGELMTTYVTKQHSWLPCLYAWIHSCLLRQCPGRHGCHPCCCGCTMWCGGLPQPIRRGRPRLLLSLNRGFAIIIDFDWSRSKLSNLLFVLNLRVWWQWLVTSTQLICCVWLVGFCIASQPSSPSLASSRHVVSPSLPARAINTLLNVPPIPYEHMTTLPA